MKKFFAVFFTLSLIVSLGVSADFDQMESSSQSFKVTSREMDMNGITLEIEQGELLWEVVGDDFNTLNIASLPGEGTIEEEGMPLVPVTGQLFRIPPGRGISVEIIDAEYETINNFSYATFNGGYSPEQFVAAPVVNDEWFPGKIADVSEPALFHDFRVANLSMFPVQVNTARNEVRVYRNIQIRINFDGENHINDIAEWPTSISEAFLPWYREFLDWTEDELDEYTLYRGHVQVVMPDDAALISRFEDWFEWKTQKGWILETLLVDNQNATAIRNELIDRYENSDPKFDYVVIIGDASGTFTVPPGTGTAAYGAGDQPYTELYGDDDLSDVGVGRISVSSVNEASVYVNKVIKYELEVDMENTDWYLRGMVSVSDNHPGNSKVQTMRYIRHALLNLGYTRVDTSWHAGNATAINRINDGVSLYGARGYINSGISTGEIANLDNDFMTPMVIDVTCGTGNWADNTGINEAYMRAGTANVPKGGIAAFGQATSGTQPNFNNCCVGGSAYSMLALRNPTIGDMMLGGKVNLFRNYANNDNGGMNTFLQWYNLMGDPTVVLWTGIPKEMTVTAEDEMVLGHQNYEVTIEDEDGPIEGAWVTFYKVDDNEEIIIRKISDANGFVAFNTGVEYAGNAVVTISKQHYKVEQVRISIEPGETSIGFGDMTIIDGGIEGTTGNENGVPEAGETIAVALQAVNYGRLAVNEVSASVSGDDPWLVSATGTINYGNINPETAVEGEGYFFIEISPEAQNDWIIHLDITFTEGDNEYNDSFPIEVAAPKFAFLQITGEELEPGNNASINLEIKNIGRSNAAAGEIEVISNDNLLSIPEPTVNIDATDIDEQITVGPFRVAAHVVTIPGYTASAKFVVRTNDGQVDTTYFSIVIGNKDSTDPAGPDDYGYYAFDDTDVDYELAPVYDWVEINPDADDTDYNGVNTGIVDISENNDESYVMELPFSIQYYGETFDEITICSNGFVAMGSQGDMWLARNWSIPSPLGANYMIAPYWDELRISDPSGVFTYYDEVNGRFIVEWYEAKHHNNVNECTFEIIFYSLEARPTYTHDNDFTFQYNTVEHSTGGMGYDVPYWTTGIENGLQTDGIMLAYYNNYFPGAAEIQNESAITFSTNIDFIVGNVSGQVTDHETHEPIAEAMVRTSDYVFFTYTDEQGNYLINEIIIGEHDLVVEARGYNNGYVAGVEIFEDQTTVANFDLSHPEFICSRDSLFVVMNPDTSQSRMIQITNDGNGPLDYSFKVLFHEPQEEVEAANELDPNELDDPWDDYYRFGLLEDEYRNRGVAYMADEFWVSGSVNRDGNEPNKFYRYDKEGVFIASYEQPQQNHSTAGFYGITSDGEYLYGADRGRIYKMQFDGLSVNIIDDFGIQLNSVRFIAYDPDLNALWLGEYDSAVFAIDLESQEVIREWQQEISPRGIAYYGDDPDDANLYFICCEDDQFEYDIRKMNTATGEIFDVIHFRNEEGLFRPYSATITNEHNPLAWTFMTVMDGLGENQDFLHIWELDINTRWIDIDPQIGVVQAENTTDINLTVYSTDLPVDFYYAWLQINHNAYDLKWTIPMIIEVNDDINDIPITENNLPEEWKFNGAYPNPFNPTINIDFSLKSQVMVNAKVFNLMGQEVAEIANQTMKAGNHSIVFSGDELASGMYFLKLEAGPLHHTQKIILMK